MTKMQLLGLSPSRFLQGHLAVYYLAGIEPGDLAPLESLGQRVAMPPVSGLERFCCQLLGHLTSQIPKERLEGQVARFLARPDADIKLAQLASLLQQQQWMEEKS